MSPRFRRVPPLPFASQRVTRRGGYLAQNLVVYNLILTRVGYHSLARATDACAVQLAARLCSHAQPEQILVSNVVAELCEGKMLPFQELGELNLKEFDQPVRAHAVNWANEASA
jgi:hypothetical protein